MCPCLGTRLCLPTTVISQDVQFAQSQSAVLLAPACPRVRYSAARLVEGRAGAPGIDAADAAVLAAVRPVPAYPGRPTPAQHRLQCGPGRSRQSEHGAQCADRAQPVAHHPAFPQRSRAGRNRHPRTPLGARVAKPGLAQWRCPNHRRHFARSQRRCLYHRPGRSPGRRQPLLHQQPDGRPGLSVDPPAR